MFIEKTIRTIGIVYIIQKSTLRSTAATLSLGQLEGVQLIFETHFESYEIFTKMLQSEEGMQIMKLMEGNDIGDYYIYWTKVRRFNSELKTSIEGYSTVQTVDVIQAIDSVAELASLRLDEQEKKGAMKALEILRKELNLINLQS